MAPVSGPHSCLKKGASVDGAPVVSPFLRLPAPWLLLAILVSALPSPFAPCDLRLWCGSRSITLHPFLLSANHGVSCPTFPHLLSYLHTAPCTCKCKTFLIPNHSLSHDDLIQLDPLEPRLSPHRPPC